MPIMRSQIANLIPEASCHTAELISAPVLVLPLVLSLSSHMMGPHLCTSIKIKGSMLVGMVVLPLTMYVAFI